MKADISIIIVNYNVRQFIKRTIESVLASKADRFSFKIYVVDNASIDGSVDMIASDFPDVELIANSDNVGFSVANNQAIRKTDSSFVLILNPDTVIEEDTLQICYDYMNSHSNVGALGVKMIDGAGNFLPESKRELPGLWNSFSKLSGLSSLFPNSKVFNSYALGHLDKDKRHDIDVLCGAFMFLRQEVIEEVGMFDERFFMYGEDIDWSRRIKEGGYNIHYIPDTTIIHYKGESTKKASLNYVKVFYGAMVLYVEKHYTGKAGKWFSRILKLAIGIRAGISGAKRLATTLIWPFLDALLIGGLIFGFSKLWAKYYFKDLDYYSSSNLNWNILLYTLIWAFVLWFVGYYQKSSWQKRSIGVLSGLVLILIGYALLPDPYRSSRVIILMGTVISFLVTAFTPWISNRSITQEKEKNILIVADKIVAEKIEASLQNAKVKSKVLGVVNPIIDDNKNLDYINDITQLRPLSKVLKADEIIFSSESMSMKDIMKQMINLDTKLSYKIAGDNSLSILGSKSKNTTGELYNVDIKYNLEDGYYRHVKRVFDLTFGLILFLLSPIMAIFNGFRLLGIFRNAFGTIIGTKTWVGYCGDRTKYQNLPELQKGVIQVDNSDDEHTSNMHYARDYIVWKDLELLLKNLNNLV